MRLVSIAFASFACSVAHAADPVCALLDPEKAPRSALLEAKLIGDPGATWVERADIDKILQEQKLQTAFSPQGIGEPVKLGKLLKADLLVMVRPVKDAKEPALEVVISETAGGLRLLIRAIPLTKSAEEDVAAMLVAVRAGIKKHGEAIAEVIAVPPFVSNDLEFSREHFKGAFAKLAESEALDRKGVVVVELAEAEALAKEIALATPGAKLVRPLPVYLLGEYRHEGTEKTLTVTLKLRAERGGKLLRKPESITAKPVEGPAAVRTWSAGVLDAMAKDTEPRPPSDAKAEAKTLAERARVFRRLGNGPETLALAEASLMLDPDQTDLYADSHTALLAPIGAAFGGAWLRKEADQSLRFAALYMRALAHLEQFVVRGGDTEKYTSVAGDGLFMAFHRAGRYLMVDASLPAHLKAELLNLREERRRVYLRMIPIFAKKDGERREYFLVWTVLDDLPSKERCELLDKIVAATEDSLYPRARAIMYASVGGHPPADTPEFRALMVRWAASDKKYLVQAATELTAKLEEIRKHPPRPPMLDPVLSNANAPGPEAVKFKPITLAFEAPMPGRAHRPLMGVLALGAGADLYWSADGLYLMKEKGQLRTVWRSPGANDWGGTGFSSLAYDGKLAWAAYNRANATPILLLIDPASGNVDDASKAEGLPNPPPSTRPEDFTTGGSPRLMLNTLEPGRACLAGSFSGRAWVGVATLDPKSSKVAVKVIHEARDVQDASDKEQWSKPDVSFLPDMIHPIRAPGEKTASHVLIGRLGGGSNHRVSEHPLVVNLEKGTSEVVKDRVWGHGGQGCAAVGGAIHFVEATLVKERTNHLVRLGFPGPKKTILAEGLSPAYSPRIVTHDGRFHIVLDQPKPQPPEKGPFTPTNPYMLWEIQWWTVAIDGKNLRQVATKLPILHGLGVSSHYGLVAMVESSPGKATELCAVGIAPPVPKK